MTIRFHLDPNTYAGFTSLVAQITNTAGAQVGSDIVLTESGTVPALFTAAFPVLAAGEYDVRCVEVSQNAVLDVRPLFWNGSVELTALALAGATFDAATDSLEALRNRGDAAWVTGGGGGSSLTAQEVRDAMKLAASAGAPAAGSVDEALTNLDVAVSTRSSHGAPDLSNLDVAVSSRLAAASYTAPDNAGISANGAAIGGLSIPTAAANAAQVRTELTTELGRIDTSISSRSSHGAPDLSNLDVAVSTRSSHAAPDLSNLDAAVSSRLAAASYVAPDNAGIAANGTALAGLSIPSAAANASQVRTELAPELARLDAAVSSRSSHGAPDLTNLDAAVSTRSSHSAGDVAAAVLSAVVATYESLSGSVGQALAWLQNPQRENLTTQKRELYDSATGTTVIQSQDLETEGSEPVTTQTGVTIALGRRDL